MNADRSLSAVALPHLDLHAICLIVNADDVGLCHSVNAAAISAMERGLVTSASLMATSPWLAEIADYAQSNPQRDFGVHLTFTCEWTAYRWPPLAGSLCAPGLCAPDGAMWPTHEQVRAQAKPAEVALEAQLQIERCLSLGVDVTHLDCHMDTLLYDAAFQQVLLEMAERYSLPVRLLPQPELERIGTPLLREQARRRGVLFPGNLILPAARSSAKEFWSETLAVLRPGLTEAFIHIGLGDEEIRLITNGDARTEEYELFGPDGTLAALIKHRGINLVGHRSLRQAQRDQATRWA